MVVVPVPSLGVDRLTDGAQYPDRAKVVGFNVVLAQTTKETDGSWSGVEVGQFVLLDGFPVARWSGINGGGFEDGSGDAIGKGSVDDVTNETYEVRGRGCARCETYV